MADPREQQLLRAVLDDPDADAPRLAYADWCKAQPDEPTRVREQFIRAQLALTDVFGPADTYPLRNLAFSLEHQYGGVWTGELAQMVDGVEFDRGFVELVALDAARFIELAQRLFALAPIRHLDLSCAKPVLEDLVHSPHLKGIRSLRLDDSDLDDDDVRLLASSDQLRELRWLSLVHNRIGMAGAVAMARSDNLRRLGYAWMFQNDVQPNQRYSYDNGVVVDDWMPKEGLELERIVDRPVRWLRHDAHSIEDSIPNRFRIA